MNILVGYDGSNAARRALELAAQHAKVFGAKLEIVTSIQRSQTLNHQEVQMAEKSLEDQVKLFFAEDDVPFETNVLISSLSPGENIVWYSRTKAIDAIFIGLKRRSKVGKLVFGSTAQYVILNAPCPVVTIR
ncbi:MAG: universal stress protein [Desulfobacterales bacterium]|nr:MAG: universal stress protein [Desulfobacterales bacterium]